MKRNEQSLWDLWNSIKRANIWIVGVKEEEENKVVKSVFKERVRKKKKEQQKLLKPENTHKYPGAGKSKVTNPNEIQSK